MEQAITILKKYWGYDSFRPLQEEIIQSVMKGENTVALLPTGGGKSICFQVPALMLDGICLVVSPLIALMHDQVSQLTQRGISAVAITSGMPHREIDVLLDNCVFGKVKFLYISPERIQTALFVARLKQMTVSLLAIDEAHCISQWGYDFRPSYIQIATIYDHLHSVKKIALTATATADVRADLIKKLVLTNAVVFQNSFARSNLSYSVFELHGKGDKLLAILHNVPGAAIVYVRSRQETQHVARYLYQQHISADFYHAGLPPKVRADKQAKWIDNKCRVIVATNAFGMGIDKPDVRVVIHLDLPDTLEAYYQEAGRAGRDQQYAYAVLLYTKHDIYRLLANEKNRNPPLTYIARVYQAIANSYKLATGTSEWQSFDFEITPFCHTYQLHAKEAYFAIQKLQEMGLLLLNDSQYKPSTIKFVISTTEVYKYNISNPTMEPLIKALLRLYGGRLYTNFIDISEYDLARMTNFSKKEITTKLNHLSQAGIVIYDLAKSLPQLTYTTPRLAIPELKKYYQPLLPRQQVIHDKLIQMLDYATNTQKCRTRIFQEYFDETTYTNCGVCDVCIRHKKDKHLPEAIDKTKMVILEMLTKQENHISKMQEKMKPNNDFAFTEAIRLLLDEQKIELIDYTHLRLIHPQA